MKRLTVNRSHFSVPDKKIMGFGGVLTIPHNNLKEVRMFKFTSVTILSKH